MENVGIVGSSYSEMISIIDINSRDRKTTKSMITWLQEINKNRDLLFFSRAKGGLGSEQFLSDVIFLKQKYNISILLIELIENRAYCNIEKSGNSIYKRILNKSTKKDIFIDLYKENIKAFYKHTGAKPHLLGAENLLFTAHDIIQTLNLCKLLDIKPIVWSFRLPETTIKYFNDMDVIDIKWGEKWDRGMGITFYEYFFNKHKGEEELFTVSDHISRTHLNDSANEELIKDFLLPKIYEFTK